MASEQSNSPQLRRKPVLGLTSLVCFFLGPLVAWITVTTGGSDEFGGLGVLAMGVLLALVVWLVGTIAGIIGLCRSERPFWPAIAGLTLTIFAVVALFILYGPK